MKVFIVVEGFQNTGYGHLTRCLAIYEAFEELDIQPTLIANCDEDGKKYLGNINLVFYNWFENSNKFLKQIKGSDITVIDSYIASKDIYVQVSESVKKAVYIDDYLRIEYPKGIIVNGAIDAENLPYNRKPDQKYLLGIDYIPLRKNFWDIPDFKRNKNVQNILITCGGRDIRGITFQILDAVLEKYPQYQYHVVLDYNDYNNKSLNYQLYQNIAFYHSLNAEEMLNLMLKCEIAISAAGQTTYELARVGLKMIVIGVANNQKYNIHGWFVRGYIEEEIWYNQKNYIEQVLRSIDNIINTNMSTSMHLDSGQGARRIVKELIFEMNNPIR